MKRNLLQGIVLVSAIAVLSSCSSTQKIASSDVLSDDDVYYTKAKAGDVIDYADAGYQNNEENYYDDYYYYGDYASRINRFGYYSPFNYWNNFNYGLGYAPGSFYGPGFSGRWFSPWGWGWRSQFSPYYGGFGWGSGFGYGGPWGYGGGWGPWGGGLYAGMGFGYGGWYGSPWFDGFYDPFFYGGWGYGAGFGGPWWGYGRGFYGGWAYGGWGGWGYGGGIAIGNYRQTPRPGYSYGQPGRPGAYGAPNNGTSPGRRPSYNNGTQTNSTQPGTRAVRPARDEVSRPSIQTQSTQGMGSSGARGGSSSGGSSGGGGGRPVRP